jgi:AraC-like DNA-binding protein
MVWMYEHRARPAALERVLPTGAAQLVVNLAEDVTRTYDPDDEFACVSRPGSILTGPTSRYQVIDTAEQEYVAGVVFRPGGTAAFTDVPGHEIADRDVALDDLWGGRLGSALRSRVLDAKDVDGQLEAIEAVLRARLRPRATHPAVSFALDTLQRSPHLASISRVTEASGLSAARLIEHFKRDVGLTPKRYCSILRFQRALRHAHQGRAVDWTGVALDCGYYDQAHFIHDFRRFSGVTPSAYEQRRTPFHNHVAIDASRSL